MGPGTASGEEEQGSAGQRSPGHGICRCWSASGLVRSGTVRYGTVGSADTSDTSDLSQFISKCLKCFDLYALSRSLVPGRLSEAFKRQKVRKLVAASWQ